MSWLAYSINEIGDPTLSADIPKCISRDVWNTTAVFIRNAVTATIEQAVAYECTRQS